MACGAKFKSGDDLKHSAMSRSTSRLLQGLDTCALILSCLFSGISKMVLAEDEMRCLHSDAPEPAVKIRLENALTSSSAYGQHDVEFLKSNCFEVCLQSFEQSSVQARMPPMMRVSVWIFPGSPCTCAAQIVLTIRAVR